MDYKEKLHNGEIYPPMDESILSEQLLALEKLYEYNTTRPLEQKRRQKLMKEMFAEVGEGCYIEPPFHANWAGKNVHLGNGVYANFNLTLVDDTHIYIGDYTLLAPNVTIASGTHPIAPELRKKGYQYNLPVHIGKNCWLGAGVVVLPGVTIGDNTVVGAGAVVTKDLPANVVAVGNPAKVLREIDERDRQYYRKNIPIDPSLFNE